MDIKENEIVLKPLQDTDIDLFSQWLDKTYIYRWLCPGGEEYRKAWLDEVNNRNDAYPYMKHFIVYYNDKKIGFCLYMDCYFDREYIPEHYGITVDKKESVFEIGYFIGEEEYLNKGIGKRIVRRLEDIITETGGREIFADPDEENTASVKTLLYNGFTKIKDGDYRKKIIV